MRVLAGELDGRGVDVLSDSTHIFVGTGTSGIDLFGVNAVLGVEVLDLTVGEDTVDETVDLELGAELGEEGKALLFAGELEKVGSLAHDGGTTGGHFENLFFLGFPGDDMELLYLCLAQQTTCKQDENEIERSRRWELLYCYIVGLFFRYWY